MKRFLIVFLTLGLAALSSLQAAPTVIQSGLGGDGTQRNTGVNNAVPLGQPNVVLAPPHPGWSTAVATSQWISFINNYSPTPNNQDPCGTAVICNGDYVAFYHDFTLSGSGNSGTLFVMADDTAGVTINGHTLFSASGPISGGATYSHCSDVVVGCLNPETIGVADLTPWLNSGANELIFTVFQRDGTGFGLDYYASVESVVPEPGFYGVLALGLSGLCLAFRRKRSA